MRKLLDDLTCRFQVRRTCTLPAGIVTITALQGELYVLYSLNTRDYVVRVYDPSNTAIVKPVVTLARMRPLEIVGCELSCRIYILARLATGHSVLCITKAPNSRYTLTKFISNLTNHPSALSLFSYGRLATYYKDVIPTLHPRTILVFQANGLLESSIILYPESCGFSCLRRVVLTSDDNLLLDCINRENRKCVIIVDQYGSALRKFISTLAPLSDVCIVDSCGRIAISGPGDELELLDSEFNLLPFNAPNFTDTHQPKPRTFLDRSSNDVIRQDLVIDNGMAFKLTYFSIVEE